ncbi:MAG: hypothetical protein KKF30_12030 [Proteobacteria bacterium]|nr:hypothetical protein [Desulfobacteraceae bacterium]MBU4054598.1 hypothetical protein [Pseudomonadota bacterium]MBU4317985.1 hypothetical protein [Pseudomonadota bacterium]MBU4469409.1 hypothetical protein [Pseudomonadota bacterium]MCG2752309.1 hypothetical protein [Desulfobacteraceae bacterium]
MSAMDEQVLRAAKEIVVKFIETGRVSPSGFSEMFKSVYSTILDSVKNPPKPSEPGNDSRE